MLRKMQIMIIEDEPSAQTALRQCLKQDGYENLLIAVDAESAFEILGLKGEDRDAPEVHLILVDIMLPRMDGIEAVKQIKSHKKFADIPMIMVSAVNDDQKLEAAFNAGAMDFIVKPFSRVNVLVRVNSALKLRALLEDHKQQGIILQQAVETLDRMASLDGLTSMYNRRSFDDYMLREFKRAAREKSEMALIMIDVDYFKDFNDKFGHVAGDQCLKKVATVLNTNVKRPGDLVARYGGEEFAVILPHTGTEEGFVVARAIQEGIAHLKIESAHKDFPYVTLSMGLASMQPKVGGIETELIIAADKALYRAKQGGRNRIEMI